MCVENSRCLELQEICKTRKLKLISKVCLKTRTTRFKLECESEHKFETNLDNLRKGFFCKQCKEDERKENQYQVIKKIVEDKLGELLSTEYISSKSPLIAKCFMGHVFRTCAGYLKLARWCPECAKIDPDTAHLNIISHLLNVKNAKLLSIKKEDGKSFVLEIECCEGHVLILTYWQLRAGEWCKECPKKDHYEIIKKIVEDKNGTLVSEKYVSDEDPIYVDCGEHIFKTTAGYLKLGRYCPKCSGHCTDKEYHYQVILDIAEEIGWEVISKDYVGDNKEMKFKCNGNGDPENRHIILKKPTAFKQGSGCPKCKNKSEEECRRIIEELTGEKFPSCWPNFLRNITGRLMQLDGYSEKLKTAMEYNGEQHYMELSHFHKHNKTLESQKKRDKLKKKQSEENGVSLMIIPYWINTYRKKKEFIAKKLEEIRKCQKEGKVYVDNEEYDKVPDGVVI